MSDNLNKISFLIFFFLFASGIFAQTDSVEYSLNLDFGFGPAKYFSELEYNDFYGGTPYTFTVRGMWQPEHLLRIGLETGYVPIYFLKTKLYDTVYGDTDVKLSLSSIPIVAIFSMKTYDYLEIFGGIGGFILISDVTSFGNRVTNTSWSNVYEFGMNYLYPVSDKIKIGAELKSYYILKLENFDLVFQFMIKYKFYSF